MAFVWATEQKEVDDDSEQKQINKRKHWGLRHIITH